MLKMSDNESESNSNNSRDLEEWVIVNQQNASDSDINDEELVNISEGEQQQDGDLIIDEHHSLNTSVEQLHEEPTCSIEEDPGSVHTSVSDCSVIFVKNGGSSNEETQGNFDLPSRSSATVAMQMSNAVISGTETSDENPADDVMNENHSFGIFGFHLGLKDSNERIFVVLVFLMISAFLAVTIRDGCVIFKNSSEKVMATPNSYDCKSNLHEKLRELASCKLTKDFCQPAEKPSCFSTKPAKNVTRDYERRLNRLKNDVKRLVEGKENLESELESVRANLTSILLAYDSLQVTKFLESDWLRRTNNFLTRQLRRASRRVVETRHKAHISQSQLSEMREKLDNLEKTIENLKTKENENKHERKVKDKTCDNENFWDYFKNLRRDINSQPTIVDLMSLYAADFVKNLEPQQKLDDLAHFTAKIFNDSLANLNVIYDKVVENSAENLKTIKKSIWNESCTTFNAIYFKLKNSSDLAAVFDTVHANLGYLWQKSSDSVFYPERVDESTSETKAQKSDTGPNIFSPRSFKYPKGYFKSMDEIFEEEKIDQKEPKFADSDHEDALITPNRVFSKESTDEVVQSGVHKNVADFDDESDLQHPIISDTDNVIIVEKSRKIDSNSELSRFIDALKKSSVKYHLGKVEYVDYLLDLEKNLFFSTENAKFSDDHYFWSCQKNWWLGYGRYLHENRPSKTSRKFDCSRYFHDWQISDYFVCDLIFDDETACQDDRRRQILRESSYLNEILRNFDQKSTKWMFDRSKLRQESRRSTEKENFDWWFERTQGRKDDCHKTLGTVE